MHIGHILQKLLNWKNGRSDGLLAPDDSIKAYLDGEFNGRYGEGLEIPNGRAVLDINPSEYGALLKSKITVFTKEAKLDAEPYRLSFQKKWLTCQERINHLEDKLSDLITQKTELLTNPSDPKPPLLYSTLYSLLLLAMFGVAAFTSFLLFEELGWVFACITSFVFAGGSFFVHKLHENTTLEKRRRFRKWLYIIGLVFFAGLGLSYAVGRGILYETLHVLVERAENLLLDDDLFNQNATTDTDTSLKTTQFLVACSAFVCTIFLEVCLGGSYLIEIVKARQFKKNLRSVEFSIDETKNMLHEHAIEELKINCRMETLKNFDDYLTVWGAETREQRLKKLNEKLAHERNQALTRISTLPNSAIGLLDSMGETYATSSQKEGEHHEEVPVYMAANGKGDDVAYSQPTSQQRIR